MSKSSSSNEKLHVKLMLKLKCKTAKVVTAKNLNIKDSLVF